MPAKFRKNIPASVKDIAPRVFIQYYLSGQQYKHAYKVIMRKSHPKENIILVWWGSVMQVHLVD